MDRLKILSDKNLNGFEDFKVGVIFGPYPVGQILIWSKFDRAIFKLVGLEKSGLENLPNPCLP